MKLVFALTLLLFAPIVNAQLIIKGKIVSKDSIPVTDAWIEEENTGNGVNSNRKGEFEIHVADTSATIIISTVASKPIKRKIHAWKYQIIVLEEYSWEYTYKGLNGSNYHFNYTEKICGLSLYSYLRYSPYGCSIDFYLPYAFIFTLLPKAQFATDFNGNYTGGFSLMSTNPFFRLNVEYIKFLYDFNVYHVSLNTSFRLTTNTFQIFQNIDFVSADLIYGVGLASFHYRDYSSKAGIILGFEKYIHPVNMEIKADAACYFKYVQYQACLTQTLKKWRLNIGVSYDQIADYKECSIKLRHYFSY